MKNSLVRLLVLGAAVFASGSLVGQTVYNGNGGSGFGGPIGQGTLSLSDDGTTLSGTITRGPGGFNDQLVIYIDSVAGGFADTSGLGDAQDGLRQAISGFNGTNRSLVTFSGGFQADYALALGPQSDSFGGLWTLAAGGNNSLIFNSNANLSPTGGGTASSASFTFSISLASIGVAPGTGFRFVTTFLNGGSAYRSNESFGNSMPNGTADGGNNIGQNPVTVPDSATYGTPVIPEPATFIWVAAGLGGLLLARRRK